MPTVSGNVSSGGIGAAMGPISAGINAAAVIAQTIAGISDQNKRRLIESNLALLSEKQKLELAQQISRQQNKNDQVTIIVNAVLAARNANADRAQKYDMVKWILIGSASVVTLGIIAWYLKKRG